MNRLRKAFDSALGYAECVAQLDRVRVAILIGRGGGLPTSIHIDTPAYHAVVARQVEAGRRFRALRVFDCSRAGSGHSTRYDRVRWKR